MIKTYLNLKIIFNNKKENTEKKIIQAQQCRDTHYKCMCDTGITMACLYMGAHFHNCFLSAYLWVLED